MKKALIIVFASQLIIGCKSCVGKFYGVHEELTPINIVFEQQTIPSALNSYIDSLNKHQAEDSNYCRPTSILIGPTNKVICFSDNPCECYFLSIEKNKIAIKAVFVPHLGRDYWLTKKEQVSDTTLERIQWRFKKEVLEKYN
jgi:hypothetical protein